MPTRIPWSPAELLLAFRLYCRTPFGKLHQHNPDIIHLARLLHRTPSAVGMKACNFASLDPAQRARNISALGNSSRADKELWQSFQENPEAIAAKAEAAYAALAQQEAPPLNEELSEEIEFPQGPTEVTRLIRTRRVQSFFRAAVLVSYDYRCALSDIALPGLLSASHIVPWNADITRRADPRNGIALNALYDRAFDRGLITFDESVRLMVSKKLKNAPIPQLQRQHFQEMEGQPLRLPQRFAPDDAAIRYHRERVFFACVDAAR